MIEGTVVSLHFFSQGMTVPGSVVPCGEVVRETDGTLSIKLTRFPLRPGTEGAFTPGWDGKLHFAAERVIRYVALPGRQPNTAICYYEVNDAEKSYRRLTNDDALAVGYNKFAKTDGPLKADYEVI